MNIGIVGLGLIGGSLAKAYKSCDGFTVYGYDIDNSIIGMAQLSGAIDGKLDATTIPVCECILIAISPKSTIEYLKSIAPIISQNTVVIDCGGTKRVICKAGFDISMQYGFTFVGGHPMGGTQYSGFKYSRANMFKGASMIIVPYEFSDMAFFEYIKKLLEPMNFGRITITTAEKHDEMIAFTSQMAHIVSNAFIKSPTAQKHKGFSAGSYKDLTRVAWLNEEMWTELFMENKDNLINELDIFIDSVSKYKQAIASDDSDMLKELLAQGKNRKEEVDGR